MRFTCSDSGGSGLSGPCPADEVLSTEGPAVSSTAHTVSDLAGNTSPPSNVVTVKIDKTAPTLACPTEATLAYNTGTQTVGVSADDGAGSGIDAGASTLSAAIDTTVAGTHTVGFIAVDSAGNSASQDCSFEVSLEAANQAIADSLAPFVSDPKVAGALEDLTAILHGDYFLDGTHLDPATGMTVFNTLQQAVTDLGKVKDPPQEVTDAIADLVELCQVLAQIAIDEAPAGSDLDKALAEMDKASSQLAKGHFAQAIDFYGKAWQVAVDA